MNEVSIVGAGLVVLLHHFDSLEMKLRQSLLNILAESARFHMLLGERMIILAQIDDPKVTYEPVGAMPVTWNPHEWLP